MTTILPSNAVTNSINDLESEIKEIKNGLVKSIFRQMEVEKIYDLEVSRGIYLHNYGSTNTVKIKAVANNDKILSDNIIGEYYNVPELEIGQKIILHETGEIVTIKDIMISTDGSITYYLENKIIETENTEKSYKECKEKIEKWDIEKEKFDKLQKKLDDCEMEFLKYKNTYKYKHRFLNIKSDDCYNSRLKEI